MRALFCLTLLLAVALTGAAQEVAYLNLIGVTARRELRHPPAPLPKCNPDGTCQMPGFSTGMSIGCGGTAGGEKRALRATLMGMDRREYIEGDSAEFEVKIENAGSVPMSIPWTPHLADLQPADETQAFTVLSLAINLSLKWEGIPPLLLASLDLYGSADHPGTIVNLVPGQWVRIRGEAALTPARFSGQRLPDPDTRRHAIAGFWMRSISYTPKTGGVFTAISNMYPLSLPGGELEIQLFPKKSSRPE